MAASEPGPDWNTQAVMAWLEANRSPDNIKGMGRFGIVTETAYGIPNAALRPFARKIARNHDRALALWETGYREARILACFTDEPKKVTAEQAISWTAEFNSWEIVDHAASLFVEARLHDELIERLIADNREFVRRTGFAMMAWGAVHLKKEPDALMKSWLPMIEKHALDEHNFVKKAVNWALRQIGKRSMGLHGPALELSQRLAESDNKTARWIGRDAVRELTSQKTLDRLEAKQQKAAGNS